MPLKKILLPATISGYYFFMRRFHCFGSHMPYTNITRMDGMIHLWLWLLNHCCGKACDYTVAYRELRQKISKGRQESFENKSTALLLLTCQHKQTAGILPTLESYFYKVFWCNYNSKSHIPPQCSYGYN